MTLYPTNPILTEQQFSSGLSQLERRLLQFLVPAAPLLGRSIPEYTLNLNPLPSQSDPSQDDDNWLEPNFDYLSVAQTLVSEYKEGK